MKKERLTEKTKDCFGYRLKDGSDAEIGFFKDYDAFFLHMMTVKALGEYEELEEQGLLIKLPCKVGDTFWELNTNTESPYVYPRIAHNLQHCVYALERLGKTTFITQSEAEEKLKELEGRNNEKC